jgi:hypothetical protein
MSDLSYPVGKFAWPKQVTDSDRQQWIRELADTPGNVSAAVEGLTGAQLDTPYRAGGWSVRQVVHHLADSHLHAYARLRLALTEDTPTIRPYDQDAWANLSDAKSGPLEPSLRMIEGLHERWVALVEGLPAEAFARSFMHPEMDDKVSIDVLLAMYAWHGRHHVAHITSLRKREGWG